MKKMIIRLYIIFLSVILYFFYDKKYLVGKQFPKDKISQGWRVALRCVWYQRIKGINRHVPWMCDPCSRVTDPENIEFDVDYIDNFFNVGCYFQAMGTIKIGKRTQIAQNVGIITCNHDVYNLDNHTEPRSVVIGNDCWIGMNSVVLPGVHLGDHTIVGAGSVVTKSFEAGRCVIAGNPAKIIRKISDEAHTTAELEREE